MTIPYLLFGLTSAWDRPRQVALAGLPVIHLAEVDPLFMSRPEAESMRALRQAQRELERKIRS